MGGHVGTSTAGHTAAGGATEIGAGFSGAVAQEAAVSRTTNVAQ
jgi:hypothetical protein